MLVTRAAPAAPADGHVRRILREFDKRGDGVLKASDLAAFIAAVNPGMAFTRTQSTAIVDELLAAYAAPGTNFITVQGLAALYADGLGDLAADWATLGLSCEEEEGVGVGKAGAGGDVCSPARVAVTVSAGLEEEVGARPSSARSTWRPSARSTAEPGASAAAADAWRPAAVDRAVADGGGPASVRAEDAPTPPPAVRPPPSPRSLAGVPAADPSSPPHHRTSPPAAPSPASDLTGKALVFGSPGADGDGAASATEGEEELPPATAAAPPRFDAPAASPAPSSPPATPPGPPFPTMDDLEAAFREWKALMGEEATPPPPLGRRAAAPSPLTPVPEDGGGGEERAPPSPTSPGALDFLRLGRLMSQRGDHAASSAAAALGMSALKAARGRRRPPSAAEVPEDDDPVRSCDPDALLRLGNAVYELGEMAAAEAAYAAGLTAAGEEVAAPADDARTAGVPGASTSTPAPTRRRGLSALFHSRPARPPLIALPLIARLRLNLGMALEAQGELAGARDQYAAAAAAAPGHPHALKLLGSVRYALGDPAGALAALDTSLAAAPAYADAHCDRGVALCAMSRASDAAAAFQAALRADPAHRHARFNLANVLRARAEWGGAVTQYRAVLEAEPGHWKARLGLGVCLIGAGRLEEAEAALEEALAGGAPTGEVEGELARLRCLAAGRRV